MSPTEFGKVDASEREEQPFSAPRSIRYHLSDTSDIDLAAHAIADGRVVSHGFANFYAMVSRPDKDVVVGINRMKGRPDDQVGSVTTTPLRVPELFDWSQLPKGLRKTKVLGLIDALYQLGPFGFRGPAAPHIPEHLTSRDGDVRTTQVIAPGYACSSNHFIARAMDLIEENFLYITSANRSRHLTGADDEPAHYRGSAIKAEFGQEHGLVILRHPNELDAQSRYSQYAPMSTTILAFHKLASMTSEDPPRLLVERHGSMHLDDLRPILERYGFGLALGPRAHVRLEKREYAGPPSIRSGVR
jgi:hypothetical protein